MMRKLHRAALAAALKPALAALSPSFSPASTAWAKAFDTERRFTFGARVDASLAFLLFEPSATSRDSYFTIDLVWLRDGAALDAADLGDDLTVPLLAPSTSSAADAMRSRARVRLRLDDLWIDSPASYRGSFAFSTAASRYADAMFSKDAATAESPEDRAFRLLQECMAAEKALTETEAAAELAPAVEMALLAIQQAALPAVLDASRRGRHEAPLLPHAVRAGRGR